MGVARIELAHGVKVDTGIFTQGSDKGKADLEPCGIVSRDVNSECDDTLYNDANVFCKASRRGRSRRNGSLRFRRF